MHLSTISSRTSSQNIIRGGGGALWHQKEGPAEKVANGYRNDVPQLAQFFVVFIELITDFELVFASISFFHRRVNLKEVFVETCLVHS